MTNKKFKVAAMSMALTACVAAQPLIANAEEGVSAVSNGTTGSTSQSEEESSTGSGTESKSSEGSSTESKSSEGNGTESSTESKGSEGSSTESKSSEGSSTESNGSTGNGGSEGNGSTGSGTESKSSESSTESKSTESKSSESNGSESKGTKDSTTDTLLPAFGTDSDKVEIKYKDSKPDPEHKDIILTEGDVLDKSKKDEITGKDGKDIGDVKKREPDIPSSTSTKVTPSTDEKDIIGKAEDGSTLVKGTEETVTKGTGTADSTTEIPDNKKNDEIDLDKELVADKDKLTWDISPTDKDGKQNTIGGYNVDKVTDSKDGDSKEITLTKSNTVTKKDMSDEDIMKLLEATTKEEKDGKTYYTKTEEIKDKDGNVIGSRTTRYEVTEKSVSSTTDTTLTIKMEKGTVERPRVDVSTEPVLPDIKKTDKETGETGNMLLFAEELEKLLEGKEPDDNGNYEFDSKGKHYVITKTITDGNKLTTNEEVYNSLKAKGEKDYDYKDGKLYYKGNELTVVQIDAIHKTLSYDVTITEVNKKPGQKDTTDSSIEEMKETAKLEAVKNALTEAAKNAGVAESSEFKAALAGVSNPNAAGFITFSVKGVTYTFNYDAATANTTTTPTTETTVDGKKAEDVKNNTVTGTAYVTDGTKSWSDSATSKADIPMLGNDFTKLPEGVAEENVVRETPGDTTSRIIQITHNGTVYEFTYSSVDAAHLTEAEKDALRQKALNAGLSDDEIKGLVFSGSLTSVTWKQTTTKIEPDNTAPGTEVKEKDTDNQIVENTDEKGTTYDITVNGETYTGLTTSDGGKTYTKTDKTSNTTTTITVNDTALNITNEADAAKIKELLRKQYGNDLNITLNDDGTASWKTDDNTTVTVDYTGLLRKLSVTQTSEGSVNKTTIEQLVGEVEQRVNKLGTGDQLKLTGKNGQSYTIERTAAGYNLKDGTGKSLGEALNEIAVKEKLETVIKKEFVSNDTNYNMSGQDIWNLLDIQQGYADGGADNNNGKPAMDSYWPEFGWENISQGTKGESYNTPTHFDSLSLDADVSFKITDEKGKEKVETGLLLSDGLTFTYGHKEDIANWCDLSKYPDQKWNGETYTNKKEMHKSNPKDASLSSTITTEKGYVWNNDTKRYQYTDNKLTYNYSTDDNNSFNGKRFYKVSGKVAYDLKQEYDNETVANTLRDQLRSEGNDQATVVEYKDKYGKTQYRVYAKVTELNAIGYMTASANTAYKQNYVNGTNGERRWTPGSSIYNGKNAGDYSLSLQGLKLVNDKVQGNYAVNYSVGTTITKSDSGTNNILTLGQKTTTTVKTDHSNEAAYSGSYSAFYTRRIEGAEGTATGGTYKSFTEIICNIFKGKGESSYDEGDFSYTYKSTDPEALHISPVSKAETTTTKAHIGYNYTTISETETIVVVPPETPDDDGGDDGSDGGDEIIDEKDSDSSVLPGTPELPPVQDAKPDAPVLPADPALPAVQDAHALPQTGVNWLAAIGLALSGMTLMITGAFASLLGKNAKH